MQKLQTIFGILLFMSASLYAQEKKTAPSSDSSFTFYKAIAGKFNTLNVDVLGNMYVITETNQLKKMNSNGDSLSTFNEVKKFGNVTSIDVSNPLKVILFYKNFTTAVVLDRQLTYRNSINFKQQNIFKVKTVTTSYDNNIWIFDEQQLKIKKIKDNGTTIQESADLRQLFDEVPTATRLIDKDNSLYLYDIQKGFFVFDYYGSLKQRLPLKGWTNIAIANNTIFGIIGDTLINYDIKTLVTKMFKLPSFFWGYKDIIAINGKVYLLKKTGIEVYTIQQ